MSESKYQVDPEKAGFELGKAGSPTPQGWGIVTQRSWHFRDKQIADKIQTVEGYSDPDYYMDCTKARIILEVYSASPWKSPGQLTAEVDKIYLENQNIDIRPNELLVGNWASDPHGIVFDPRSDLWFTFDEFYGYGKAYEFKDGKLHKIEDENFYNDMKKFCERWNLVYAIKPYIDPLQYDMYMAGQRYWETPGTTGFRANPDHEWYMKQGLRKLIDMTKDTIKRLEEEAVQSTGNEFVKLRERIDDCHAMTIATEAVIAWIKRHADMASEMATKEKDPKERERLETIASNCSWVAENAPRTFSEMMQLFWLSFIAHGFIEHASHSVTFRPDQSWYSWYKKDVEEDKTLDRITAGEYVAAYFMKYHEQGLLVDAKSLRSTGLGTRDYSVVTVAGQTSDGADATNDLTMLILDVIDGYRLHFPDVKVRWHTKFNRNNMRRVVEVMRTGLGSPSLRNDVTAIPELMNHYNSARGGLTIEEARSWAVVGCNTPGVTINSRGASRRAARELNTIKSLEFTFFNGRDPEPEWNWVKSIETGDPAKFKDFEEFYQAWLKQYEWLLRTGMNLRNVCDEHYDKITRRPYLSTLYRRCVEDGVDVMLLDVPWLSFNDNPGWVDCIDALAGLKYLVYDKKKYTMEQLLEAMTADWEGFEDMRQEFKDAPKFGNNDDYVDSLFAKATNDVGAMGKHVLDNRNNPGGYMNALVLTWMYHLAAYSGAIPNGRKRGEPLCDGGINPHAEFDKGGAWDRLASAMKIDQSKFKAWIYNQKFDYSTVEGEAGLEKMVEFTMAGLEGGMDQLQYNLQSRDMLRDAQKNPEKYPYLSVRISGYSAYFTSLPEYVQNAVIDRVDHEL